MAITRDKKQALVADMKNLLENAKMTVYAKYEGLSVANMEELRKHARENGVKIRIVKNRLLKVAMNEIGVYKDADTSGLTGQLLYAMSDSDEVAPAGVLDKFAKTHAALQIQGGFSGDGETLAQENVLALAKLPSKNQLIAETVAMLLSPVNDTVNALSGNLHALLDGIEAKASA
ncbi:MAG: 50S ribosomal protein L10 [Candidatus Nomurabacteria bacterium]|jgi:large subunit ribosomal protein L10|nr:50S ribosomal protein L10 [Candidatus Nomurabacteria bacterium]